MNGIIIELCSECGGCSKTPTTIDQLCTNPIEKYLYRKGFLAKEAGNELYLRGRKDGMIMKNAEWQSRVQRLCDEL